MHPYTRNYGTHAITSVLNIRAHKIGLSGYSYAPRFKRLFYASTSNVKCKTLQALELFDRYETPIYVPKHEIPNTRDR